MELNHLIYDDEDNKNNYEFHSSAEETDDASEAESNRNDEPIEIKEQMFQDKLAGLKKELDDLHTSTHPELIRKIKKLEQQYYDRLRLNEAYRDYMLNCVENDYTLEVTAAVKEYEEKKTDLRENLLADFEDKKKLFESERTSMELIESGEHRQTITRKLRRRPNDPAPIVEKRRKPGQGSGLIYLLEDKDVDNDLKQISRGKISLSNNSNNIRQLMPLNNQSSINNSSYNSNSNGNNNYKSSLSNLMSISSSNNPIGSEGQMVETRIEDGKLMYERRWFHRGQAVYVEGQDLPRFSANILNIGNELIWVKRTSDSEKIRISTHSLSRGKISIKRRAN